MSKRKPYRRRIADPMGGVGVLMRAKMAKEPMTQENVDELHLGPLSALDAVSHGYGTRHEWDVIARAMNHAWTLACNHIGPEAKEQIQRAEEGMRRAIPRYEKTGRVVLDGDALRDVRAVLMTWADQLRLSTVGEMHEATLLVQRYYSEVRA